MSRGLVCLFLVCVMSFTHMGFDTYEEYHSFDHSASSDTNVMYSTYYEDNSGDADSNILYSDVEDPLFSMHESGSLPQEDKHVDENTGVAADANE